MRELLVPLERGGIIAVAGEAELLKGLEDRLVRAHAAMRELTHASGRRIDTELDTLKSLLTGPDWDLGRELQAGLADKQRRQDEAVQEYDSQARDWRAKVNRLKYALNTAIAEGALVASETEAIRTLEDLVMQAERALREQRYGEVSMPLHRLTQPPIRPADSSPTQAPTANPRSVEQLAEDISNKTLQAREDFARRAELLLLKGASAGDRVESPCSERSRARPAGCGMGTSKGQGPSSTRSSGGRGNRRIRSQPP